MWLANFQAYKADFVDKTPYNYEGAAERRRVTSGCQNKILTNEQ